MNEPKKKFHPLDYLWDLWCVVSVVGIWPRYIEPNLLTTTQLNLKVPNLPEDLTGMRILQFSDLHLHSRMPDFFLKKIVKKIMRLSPDMIVFTGDFLCYSKMPDQRLKRFLNDFDAPFGCYAILGNHDYQECISVNDTGDYDVVDTSSSLIGKVIQRIFSEQPLTSNVTEKAGDVASNRELVELLKETPFELLDNATKLIPVKGSALNVCGVGEHMLGRCLPEKAFEGYDNGYPGLVLAHNPDCIAKLGKFPGDVILFGHTHGAQVNIPWLWKRFVILENMQFKRGLFREGSKWIYVNRGVGSTVPFRWFSAPEITLVTLEKES